ncbi:hypothetical protein ACJX0J_042128, partial [Zea mays]
EHAEEKKCLKCGQFRFVEVVNDEGEKVMTDVAHKQLRYLSLTPRVKQMFLSKKTVVHMRWHKEGVRDNDDLIVHPSDGDAWKALDMFDPDFAADPRNARIGLATDGFRPFGQMASSYSCWTVFVIPYNLPPSLCMKYEFIFLSLIIPGLDYPGKNLNVMLKHLIEELKELWKGVEAYDVFTKQIFKLRVLVTILATQYCGVVVHVLSLPFSYYGQADNFILAHQCEQVYYMSYPNPKFKAWWVVHKEEEDNEEEVQQHEKEDEQAHEEEEVQALCQRLHNLKLGQWDDTSFDGRGQHRQVNQVLGNLCRLHNPGIVTDPKGVVVPCTSWSHFALAPHGTYGTTQGTVKHDFWRRYRVEPEAQEHADRLLEKNAKKVSRDAFSNARLQVVNAYMKRQ